MLFTFNPVEQPEDWKCYHEHLITLVTIIIIPIGMNSLAWDMFLSMKLINIQSWERYSNRSPSNSSCSELCWWRERESEKKFDKLFLLFIPVIITMITRSWFICFHSMVPTMRRWWENGYKLNNEHFDYMIRFSLIDWKLLYLHFSSWLHYKWYFVTMGERETDREWDEI